MQLKMTFYGFPDNTPPSDEIAYPSSENPGSVHERAGGTGTFDDPITVAAVTDRNGGNWSPGTRMYVPSLKKYLILEDECASCGTDQLDVWMQSGEDCPSDAVLQCENAWTPGEPVEVEFDPPPDREVDGTPFFDSNTCGCLK